MTPEEKTKEYWAVWSRDGEIWEMFFNLDDAHEFRDALDSDKDDPPYVIPIKVTYKEPHGGGK